MRSLVSIYIQRHEKEKVVNWDRDDFPDAYALCMFQLIIEVKTQPKYITNCLLCADLLVILCSISANRNEKIDIHLNKIIRFLSFSLVLYSYDLLAKLKIVSCWSRDSNSILIKKNKFLFLLYISTHHLENEENVLFKYLYYIEDVTW